MKFAFVTCVKLGFSCIERIFKDGGYLNLLITLKDDKAINKSGRIYLDEFAKNHNIPLLKINHINDREVFDAIKRFDIDYLFIIGWSQIADKTIINLPSKGTFGIHPTLLPEGRGRASIPWAIIKNLRQTGVTMFKLDEGVDTGLIIDQLIVNIDPDETATTLYNKIMDAHTEIISIVYEKMLSNKLKFIKQDEAKATYWPGRKPEDGELNTNMSTIEALRLIRATTHPYPGAFIKTEYGKRVIWDAIVVSENDPTENVIRFKDGILELVDFEDINN